MFTLSVCVSDCLSVALSLNAAIPTGYIKWKVYLTKYLTLTDWEQSFTRMYMNMKCSKYLAIQFKILYFILVTKEKLLQWGLAQDDICTFLKKK